MLRCVKLDLRQEPRSPNKRESAAVQSACASSHQPCGSAPMEQTPTYNEKVVRQFTIMTVVWGVVGMAGGVLIAAQLYFPALNFDLPWLTFSRLRPLHTNAVIFAFGGCGLIATS